MEVHSKPDPYEIEANLGRYGLPGLLGMTAREFWEPMGYSFWVHLPTTEHGAEILGALELLVGAPRVCILTSPASNRGAVEGKVAWIRRELPEYRRRFLVGPDKTFCAGPGSLLVDDFERNCLAFEQAGGASLLVPAPWNRLHDQDPRECLDRLRVRFG